MKNDNNEKLKDADVKENEEEPEVRQLLTDDNLRHALHAMLFETHNGHIEFYDNEPVYIPTIDEIKDLYKRAHGNIDVNDATAKNWYDMEFDIIPELDLDDNPVNDLFAEDYKFMINHGLIGPNQTVNGLTLRDLKRQKTNQRK